MEGYPKAYSEMVFDVEKAAIRSLKAQMAPLVAKRLAAIVAKKAASKALAKKNEGLGAIADIAMQIAERADLRQWSLLPKTFQIARLRVNPGTYSATVYGIDGGNETMNCEFKDLKVKKNEKKVINCRGF